MTKPVSRAYLRQVRRTLLAIKRGVERDAMFALGEVVQVMRENRRA